MDGSIAWTIPFWTRDALRQTLVRGEDLRMLDRRLKTKYCKGPFVFHVRWMAWSHLYFGNPLAEDLPKRQRTWPLIVSAPDLTRSRRTTIPRLWAGRTSRRYSSKRQKRANLSTINDRTIRTSRCALCQTFDRGVSKSKHWYGLVCHSAEVAISCRRHRFLGSDGAEAAGLTSSAGASRPHKPRS